MPQVHPAQVLRFGVFEVNLSARELRKHGVRVRLTGQPYAILTMLLEKPGEIVTREEMRAKLWPADTFVDFEHGLNSCIKKLRAALNDTPENSRYIETVPRVGYRFIAPVANAPGPGVENDVDWFPIGSAEAAIPPEAPRSRSRRMMVGIALGLILGLGGSFAWSWLRNRVQRPSKMADVSHAGATRERNTAAIGRGGAASPTSAEVHGLYSKGMYYLNERRVGGFQEAIQCFEQAIAKDPNYAPAYAGLANSYTLLTGYSSSPSNLYMPQARSAALRAIQLDEKSAEGHTALALIVQNEDWDWQTSEKEYRQAIELDPNYATAHHWYAEHLMWQGRFDEALRESDRARELDPLSVIIATDHGAILFYSRQYDRAIEHLQTLLKKEPGFPRAVGLLIQAYVEKGMYKQALKELKTGALYRDGPTYWEFSGYIYGRAGEMELAQHELEKLEKLNQKEQQSPGGMISLYLAVGNKEEALSGLEKAYVGHYSFLAALKVDPGFDPVRGDPRFRDLLHRVGLGDSK